ncbi:fungal-specific transcription factor domain-containing protein [Geopyxis carbonaria]|nr:fungal-specific transcription factor domain-containing protein [Geopyxis carbonaria]
MRSSIACVRCRRSKVKCVNTGPNTTCKACESSNRDCTYPQPVQSGTPRANVAGMTINSVAGAGTGGNTDRIEAPKKSKPKKPAPSANAATTPANINTPKGWKECLDSPVLNQTTWKMIFDAYQLHHSPMLPFLHPPTFMNRLRASIQVPSGGSPPAPEKPHSPLVLLGILALTSRHIQPLVSRLVSALATPIAVSEFYASALKYRLKHEEEDGFLVPSVEKVQALLMLSVHEWGQTRKSEAYMWLGVAIRMTGALGLSWVDDEAVQVQGSPEPETDGPVSKRRKLDNGTSVKLSTASVVDKEVRRRTFWAVFILDRALSSGKFFPSGLSTIDASRVLLPCEDRAFMFGISSKTGYLRPDVLLHDNRNGDLREAGDEERILAQIVKAMEIWGRIQTWSEMSDSHPTSTASTYHKLSTALEVFVETLPQQLVFSLNTLQVHTSTQSSSAYCVLHTTLFLARITLEKKFLPQLPLLFNGPSGPSDPNIPRTAEEMAFYGASAERFMAAARDMVTLVTGLEEWNAGIENPLLTSAMQGAAEAGLYAYNFPWMDPRGYLTANSSSPDSAPMGSGEEPNKAVAFLHSVKARWPIGEEAFDGLLRMQSWVQDQEENFMREDSRGREMLAEKSRRIPVNSEEKNRLFRQLAPATPKPQPAVAPIGSHNMQVSSSDVDALLLAASGSADGKSSVHGDRWMAVNTLPAGAVPQPAVSVSGQKQDGYLLDTLAGFAAQQGKIGNGSSEPKDQEMADGNVVKIEAGQTQQSGPDRQWIDETQRGNTSAWSVAVTDSVHT